MLQTNSHRSRIPDFVRFIRRKINGGRFEVSAVGEITENDKGIAQLSDLREYTDIKNLIHFPDNLMLLDNIRFELL